MKTTDNNSRDRILRRLREATSPLQISKRAANSITPEITDLASQSDLELFKALLIRNHSRVIECDERQFSKRLDLVLQEWQKLGEEQKERRITSSSHPVLRELLDPETLATGLNFVASDYDQDACFDHCEASICMADAAVAELGCLLVTSSAEQPRGLSLIPERNILVVRQDSIVQSLDHLFRGERWPRETLPSNLLLISGPSKTADIQQTLAYGAHGPKELVVFILS